MTRRSLSPRRKREIAAFNGWRTREGEQVAIENGELVTLHDGRKVEYDHIYQLALGGSDEIENMQPMTPEAHAAKTNKFDAKVRAKDRRLRGFNKPKRKYNWPTRPFFKSEWKRRPDGSVVLRDATP